MSYASDALIDALDRDNKRLKAKNENLRKHIECKEHLANIACYENIQLRELAKEAVKVAHELCGEYSAPCSLCAVDRCDTGCKLDWIDKLARELGIEIGEQT